ncbi:MAG: hypothetical protein ACFFCP_09895 [Promethearchaeota archaeon]
MSKKRSTKSSSIEEIEPDGVSLSVRLFYLYDMSLSANQLLKFMKDHPFTMVAGEPTEGFTKVSTAGTTVSADFIASFRQPVYAFVSGQLVERDPIFTVKKSSVSVNFDRNFVEVHGSGRLAARFRTLLRKEEVARIAPVTITDEARTIFDEIKRRDKTEITYALISFPDIESKKTPLDHVEFKGENIQNVGEINLYQTRWGGTISKFSGNVLYPSTRLPMKTTVNFKAGSLSVTPPFGETKINAKSLRWLVTMLEKSADPYPPPDQS